ncbi:hypothetical protein [Falsigemmobacter faecalis]|uniref:Uncharacterized protein n=1 Tax=Falsigemmobacter faecalis TaxID=2488730 RepID=A0A3P3D9N4_9RHOB|nr:hypothetical protein [Falsigemmobacter faecalis]RRH71063.1 hypothetical protein EG244_16835 [Falsigemmobacter faecalis]
MTSPDAYPSVPRTSARIRIATKDEPRSPIRAIVCIFAHPEEGKASPIRIINGSTINAISSKIAPKGGLSQSKIDEILRTRKGQRPDPSAYMSKAEIDAHLSKFDGGAVRVTSADDVAKYGTAGPPSGGFVMPKSEFDYLVREAGGNMRVVERRLGLDSGSLSSGKTVALEIKPQDMRNLRVPSGNEGGANGQWVPGGYTSGGVPEAVMDFSGVPYTPIKF